MIKVFPFHPFLPFTNVFACCSEQMKHMCSRNFHFIKCLHFCADREASFQYEFYHKSHYTVKGAAVKRTKYHLKRVKRTDTQGAKNDHSPNLAAAKAKQQDVFVTTTTTALAFYSSTYRVKISGSVVNIGKCPRSSQSTLAFSHHSVKLFSWPSHMKNVKPRSSKSFTRKAA